MSPKLHSISEVLEIRDRCRNIKDKESPEKALKKLVKLEEELPFSERAEAWEAIASLGTREAAIALRYVLEGLMSKHERKRMRTILHHLRSRGIREADPSAPLEESRPAGPEPPKDKKVRTGGKTGRKTKQKQPQGSELETWITCCDSDGTYSMAAYLNLAEEGILALGFFTVEGTPEFDFLEVPDAMQAERALQQDEDEATPPFHKIDPKSWLEFARLAGEEHGPKADLDSDDPGDHDPWAMVKDAVRRMAGSPPELREPRAGAPQDRSGAARELVDSEDYETWVLHGEEIPWRLTERLQKHPELAPGSERDRNWESLYEELVREALASGTDKVWKAALAHNARVHQALGDHTLAGLEISFAETLNRENFKEHPFTRAVAEATPVRIASPQSTGDAFVQRWNELGWGVLEIETDSASRFYTVDNILGLWIAEHERERMNPGRAGRRLWGKKWEAYLQETQITARDTEHMLLQFEFWDFRVTHRSKTLAERVFEATAEEVPEEVRVFWQARLEAVTSLFVVRAHVGSGVVEVEDLLLGGRVQVRAPFTWDYDPAGEVIIGGVFSFARDMWIVPWCLGLQPPLGEWTAEHVESEWKKARGKGAWCGGRKELSAAEFLRKNPEVLGRGLRKAEERFAKLDGLPSGRAMRPGGRFEAPVMPGGGAGLEEIYRPRLDFNQVLQFRISLDDVEPEVWRRIQVPDCYSLWDLHVAIQDAMGWEDYHLHAFDLVDPKTGMREKFGIPSEHDLIEDEDVFFPGWEAQVSDFFTLGNRVASYVYDFGDDWRHTVILEEVLPPNAAVAYPRCIDGGMACPPEDCGGPPGYEHLLEILANPGHDEHEETRVWAGEFNAERFDSRHVDFEDPGERWRVAILGEEDGFR